MVGVDVCRVLGSGQIDVVAVCLLNVSPHFVGNLWVPWSPVWCLNWGRVIPGTRHFPGDAGVRIDQAPVGSWDLDLF